jgi:LEA14-like dessication related protein
MKQNTKTAALFSIAALATAVFTAGFLSCASLGDVVKEPKITFSSVDITAVNFEGISLLAKVRIENPNRIEIPFPQTHWELFVDRNSFVRGTIDNGRPIAARQATVVDVPFSLTYAGLFGTFNSLREADETEYRIQLGAEFDIPVLGKKRVDTGHTGRIPILKLPGITLQGIRLKNAARADLANPAVIARLGKLDFEVTLEVENRNAFPITIKQFEYDFRVNNTPWTAGTIARPPRLPRRGRAVIPLSVTLNSTRVASSLARMIAGGTLLDYQCSGGIALSGDLPGFADVLLPINLGGTVSVQ